jgi:hypothetical protein
MTHLMLYLLFGRVKIDHEHDNDQRGDDGYDDCPHQLCLGVWGGWSNE